MVRSRSGGTEWRALQPVIQSSRKRPERIASFTSMFVAASTRTSTFTSGAGAQPGKLPILQHVQQLGLQVGAHLRDFIQENRAVVGELEFSGLGAYRAGKSSLLVTEQFRFQKFAGQCRAIHLDEGLRRRSNEGESSATITSLPTPLSPLIKTGTSTGAICSICWRIFSICGLAARNDKSSVIASQYSRSALFSERSSCF